LNCEEKTSDGRLDSALNEKKVIDILSINLKGILPSKIRGWYDFLYKGYPVNIKITKGSTDNAFNKKSLIYSLTTHDINSISSSSNWKSFSKYISSKIKDTRDFKEYYYLVIFKDGRLPIIKSVIDIVNIKSNPTNILQINWNKEFVDSIKFQKDFKGAYSYIIKTIQKSCEDKVKDIKHLLDITYLDK
jgi:hypothetical protein